MRTHFVICTGTVISKGHLPHFSTFPALSRSSCSCDLFSCPYWQSVPLFLNRCMSQHTHIICQQQISLVKRGYCNSPLVWLFCGIDFSLSFIRLRRWSLKPGIHEHVQWLINWSTCMDTAKPSTYPAVPLPLGRRPKLWPLLLLECPRPRPPVPVFEVPPLPTLSLVLFEPVQTKNMYNYIWTCTHVRPTPCRICT